MAEQLLISALDMCYQVGYKQTGSPPHAKRLALEGNIDGHHSAGIYSGVPGWVEPTNRSPERASEATFGEKDYMNTNAVDNFVSYVDDQITPAVADVGRLPEASRKHVQRLIYTNLVDRFDVMVDTSILDNCRTTHLIAQATAEMTSGVTEAALLKLLMSNASIQDAIDERLRVVLRNTALRERHSKKLATLMLAAEEDTDFRNKPRVNISTGKILNTITPKQKTIPYSICGYADWLYSRRNSVVHGGGTTKFLDNDRTQLAKLYKCNVAKNHQIKLASTTVAAAFYKEVAAMLKA